MSSLNLDSAPEPYSLSDPSVVPNAFPVIDLADPNALGLMRLACESWGAFQLTGHNVPHHVLDNINSEARRLYALSAEEEMKIARVAGSTLLLKTAEGFSTKSNFKLWRDDTTFRNVAEEYRKEMNSVSTKLVQLMLLSLGFTEADIKRADPLGLSQKEPNYVLQLNWYPACAGSEREIGMPHHTDSGILSVLYNKNTGLQVLSNEDQHGPARWVTVPLVPDSLIVLVGDLGHILSNGRFRSVIHRAMANQDEPRISVVYFWYPGDNVMVSPLVSEFTGKPVYCAMTWPEYLAIKRKVFIKMTELEEAKKDDSYSEVAEERKKYGSASEVEEEKKVPELDHEKKNDSTAGLFLYKVFDSIKLVEVKEETASEVEEENTFDSIKLVEVKEETASEVEEENKVPELDHEKKDDSTADLLLYKALDSIKLVESTAAQVEDEKNGSPEVEEEK